MSNVGHLSGFKGGPVKSMDISLFQVHWECLSNWREMKKGNHAQDLIWWFQLDTHYKHHCCLMKISRNFLISAPNSYPQILCYILHRWQLTLYYISIYIILFYAQADHYFYPWLNPYSKRNISNGQNMFPHKWLFLIWRLLSSRQLSQIYFLRSEEGLYANHVETPLFGQPMRTTFKWFAKLIADILFWGLAAVCCYNIIHSSRLP